MTSTVILNVNRFPNKIYIFKKTIEKNIMSTSQLCHMITYRFKIHFKKRYCISICVFKLFILCVQYSVIEERILQQQAFYCAIISN